jgi:hypothetical protein
MCVCFNCYTMPHAVRVGLCYYGCLQASIRLLAQVWADAAGMNMHRYAQLQTAISRCGFY